MDRGEVFDAQELFADCIDFAPDPDAVLRKTARKQAARAIRLRTRVHARRALSEATLAGLLPVQLEDGDSWHVVSGGNVDGMSYLAHLLAGVPQADHVLLSTWCMSLDDVEQIAAWLAAGRIQRLDIYVGEIFPSQYAAAHTRLCEVIRAANCGRVAVFRNHSKVTVIAHHAGSYYAVVESSANLNTNPRTEQATVTRSFSLAAFYRDFFDGIRSIVRNFDHWTPHGWPPAQAHCPQAR